MSPHHTITGFQPVPHDRLRFVEEHDPYRFNAKPHEPTVCPECKAVFHDGRWQWLDLPNNAHQELCPACRRTTTDDPAGYLTLEGPFLTAHSDEIMRLVHNHAEHERAEHPLQRIIAIKKENGSVLITTTDIHLARGIGEALQHAYRGELEFHYNKEDNLLRVHWIH